MISAPVGLEGQAASWRIICVVERAPPGAPVGPGPSGFPSIRSRPACCWLLPEIRPPALQAGNRGTYRPPSARRAGAWPFHRPAPGRRVSHLPEDPPRPSLSGRSEPRGPPPCPARFHGPEITAPARHPGPRSTAGIAEASPAPAVGSQALPSPGPPPYRPPPTAAAETGDLHDPRRSPLTCPARAAHRNPGTTVHPPRPCPASGTWDPKHWLTWFTGCPRGRPGTLLNGRCATGR